MRSVFTCPEEFTSFSWGVGSLVLKSLQVSHEELCSMMWVRLYWTVYKFITKSSFPWIEFACGKGLQYSHEELCSMELAVHLYWTVYKLLMKSSLQWIEFSCSEGPQVSPEEVYSMEWVHVYWKVYKFPIKSSLLWSGFTCTDSPQVSDEELCSIGEWLSLPLLFQTMPPQTQHTVVRCKTTET
jgi:hypothetical protein